MLKIIDVSSNQGLIKIEPINCEGVMIKATGGTSYINDCCDFVAQQCIKLNRPFGVYHYAHEFGHVVDATTESNYFIDNIQGYLHKGILALDYEVAINGNNYTNADSEWCYEFCKNVNDKTGVVPLLYISKSLLRSCDCTKVAGLRVALWFAQYADNNATGWQADPWTDNEPFTPFTPVMHQFSSHGQISGYRGSLDLNIFYGDQHAWQSYANPLTKSKQPESKPVDYLTPFAQDVINGKYGNGSERKENIFNAVQNKVNELLHG